MQIMPRHCSGQTFPLSYEYMTANWYIHENEKWLEVDLKEKKILTFPKVFHLEVRSTFQG